MSHAITTRNRVRRATKSTAADNGLKLTPESRGSRLPRPWRYLAHPLTAILAVQAGLSVALAWSNTAFADEANYLTIGRQLIGHWLHGTPWPLAYATSGVSGLPYIYPLLGAIANGIGGLVAARILSLIFMLVATWLLYSTASQLFGSTVALFACAFWVAHSPTIQLGAFATFDAMSVSLMALAGWLAVQASARFHRGEFVAAAAVVLALSNLTAYSAIVMDPLLIAFAFLVWLPSMGLKLAASCTAWFIAAFAVTFGIIMTVAKSWQGIMVTVFARAILAGAYATPLHVFEDSWTYTGLILILGIIGTVISIGRETRLRTLLIAGLAAAALVVPLAQAHETTAVSLKKHLAYGAWFAAMAAGYACYKLIERTELRRPTAVICCSLAFAYPLANGWWAAWEWYHSWYNSTSLISAVKRVSGQTGGAI